MPWATAGAEGKKDTQTFSHDVWGYKIKVVCLATLRRFKSRSVPDAIQCCIRISTVAFQ